MDKKTLRASFLQQRFAIDAHTRNVHTNQAMAKLVHYLTPHAKKRIALYHPIKGELSPLGITALLLPTYHYCLPVVTDNAMTFYAWNPTTPLQKGAYGIAEPANTSPCCIPDIIITPLLAIDKHGYRLGYGKGYYDRYFAAHPDILRIGIGFSLQYCDALPHEPHDVPLHVGVNEMHILHFG